MKKLTTTLIVLGFAGTLLLVALPPARAHASWSVGTAFSVGRLQFDLVFGPTGIAPRYGADFYFRTRYALPVRGLSCHAGCFRDRSYSYHHPACAAVGHYFGVHRFSPRLFVRLVPAPYRWRYERYYRAPSYDRYRYRHDDHYDRYRHDDRYDRRDDGQRDRRYAVPDRGRGGRDDHRGRGRYRDDDSDSNR